MAAGDIVRAVATFTGDQGQLHQWVWHYIVETTASFLWQQVADAVEAKLADAWADIDQHVDSEIVGDTLELLLWDATLGEFNGVVTNDISTFSGLTSQEAMPANVAPYVTFPTSIPKSRGKKFLFGIGEGSLADGILQATFLADCALFAADFNDQVVGGGNTFTPGNFNITKNRFLRWSSTNVIVGAFSGSQYRRLPGRGA